MPDEQEILAQSNAPDFVPGSNDEDQSIDLQLSSVQDELIDDTDPDELGEEVESRLSYLEDFVDQIPQPPFFPGLAIFQTGTGSTYSELVPLNNTLSLAGTGSFIYTGGTDGAPAIALAANQFVGVLSPDGQNIAVIKISGGGNFAVKVKQNGTSGGFPVYDLYSETNTTSKLNSGSPLAPFDSRARLNGSLTITAVADYTYGEAFYDDAGNIALWDVPETICSGAAPTLGVYP